MFASPSPTTGQFKGAIVIFILLHISRRRDSKVIDMKRREGRGGGMGRRDFGRSRERRGRGKKKKGRRKIHRPHVLRFYESEGNRFRERKGAALIALPARSRGLGTRSFFLPPLPPASSSPPPILFLSPAAFSRQTRYFDLPQRKPTCPTLDKWGMEINFLDSCEQL